MSCYEEERGGWTFPTKNWTKVRTRLIEAEYKMNEDYHKVLTELWNMSKTMSAKAFKDNLWGNMGVAEKKVFGQKYVGGFFGGGGYQVNTPSGWCRWVIEDKIAYGGENGSGKMKKPLKPKKRKKEDDMDFSFEDACLSLSHKSRRIDWTVFNNNHSVDRSWSHPIGQELNKILRETEFKGKNGGYTIYRCEYQEDFEPSYNNVYGPEATKRCWGR